MPELPEVETVMRGLAPWMAGARFVKVEQRRADLRFPFPPRFPERLEGRRVEELERRAKYILAHLEGGEVLVMHLGMSGRMLVAPAAVGAGDGGDRLLGRFLHNQGGPAPGEALPASPHDHVVFAMSSGARITFNDARRFGMMDLIEVGGLCGYRLFRDLGPEPLGPGLTADYLAKAAAGRAVDLKAFLLDQRTVAGIGNIYASEILHRCRLSPSRLAHTLALKDGRPAARTAALVDAIRAVLAEAIAAGGSTLRDYVHTDGELGYFQHAFRTYDRDGEPCPRSGCRGVIRRTVQAGRSTFHCPLCQR